MNDQCYIVQDLMPLYTEDMLSVQSKKFVDEHLKECHICQMKSKQLINENNYEDTNEKGIAAFKEIKQQIKNKRINNSIIISSIVAIIIIIIFSIMSKPQYLPYEKAVNDIAITSDNGKVVLSFTGEYELYDDGHGNYDISLYTTLWNNIVGQRMQTILINNDNQVVNKIYYVSNGRIADQIIYGIDDLNNGRVTLPSLYLNYYFMICAIATVILAAFYIIMIRNIKLRKILVYVMFAPIAYMISAILINGFPLTSYNALRDLVFIIILMIPIYTLLISLYKNKLSK